MPVGIQWGPGLKNARTISDLTVYTLRAFQTTNRNKELACTAKKWAEEIAGGPSPNTPSVRTAKTSGVPRCAAAFGCDVPCYHPLHGYFSRKINPTGKRSVVFKLSQGLVGEPVSIPCGRCIGCRLELSRQWALRCVHEASLHQDSAFITLTYDEAHLPYGGTLIKKHFQDFMKRLRRRCGKKLSYYHCGEYGEHSFRPHYHALLFGVDFPDKVHFKNSKDGSRIYTSELLQCLWSAGFCTTGAVTFESAAYVARYVMKKITGKPAAGHYRFIDPGTGEVVQRVPEYTTMSLKPAIAKNWYASFKKDVYPSDFCVSRGQKMKPPKYYDRLLELEDPEARARIKASREREALLRQGDSTTVRLRVREKCKLAQIKTLTRGLE